MKKLIITDGGKIMIVFRLVFAFLILTTLCKAQKEEYKLNEKLTKRQSVTDTVAIKSLITDFITVGRIGNTDRIKMFLSSKLVTNKNLNTKNIQFNISQFNINDISVSTTGDNATAEFNIVNVLTKEILKERMTFERESGQWKITNSTLLLDIMQKTIPAECENEFDSINPSLYTTKSKTKANLQTNGLLNNSTTSPNTYDVSQFYLSTTALIKRHTMLTALNDNILTINRSLVKNRLGGPVFTAINEGKFVFLEGDDEDIFGIVADSGWNRIVYGSANNKSINSYGDHNGDHGLDRASSVAVDKFGNVLVLAGVPTRIYKFKYDKTSDYLNFNKIITLPGVQEATDICFDYAGTPDIPDDDSFWLTDKKGDAIFNLTLDGQFPSNKPGLYYRVMNAAGEVLEFNGPTRVVANYGKAYFQSFDKNLAIIDSDKKRIVIIDFISTFEGNTIRGEYTVVNFTGQTNVSLNSIGYPFTPYESVWQTANGLWVADPNNNMFHIFDGNYTRTGYLGSIKSLSSGIDEWASPKSLISTSMSNSPLDATDFVTMDKYDDTHGMNTYFTGVDMVNIITHQAWGPNTGIDASFPTSTIVSQIAIYNLARSDPFTFVRITTHNWAFPAGRVKDIIIGNTPGDFPVGKYEALFTLIPAENSSSYRSGYQQTVIKSVQFAMPPDGTLTGPLWGMSGTNYTWQINMTCGSGDFTYTWSKQDDGSNVWQPISSSAWKKTILQMGGTSFTLKCDVTDNFNGQIKSFTQHISSGILVADESWFGAQDITGPITVPAGITLTIYKGVTQPFTYLGFANNASLTVNGTLNVIGTSIDPIYFDGLASTTGKWGSLKFDGAGASSSVLDHAVIKNAINIQILNNANVTIKNSTIKDCTQGVYVYNASPQILNNQILNPTQHGIYVDASGKSPLILDNVITKTSDRTADYKHQEGIIVYNGTIAYMAHNDISGFDHGIYLGGGTIGRFTNYNWQNYYPNNRLTGNRYGVMVGWGSNLIGGYGYNYCWNNTIYNNDYYNAYVYQSSVFIAQNDYWGIGNLKQYHDASSPLVATPALTSDPWIPAGGGGSQSIIAANTEFPEIQISSTDQKSTSVVKNLSKQPQQTELDNGLSAAKEEDEFLKEIRLEREGKIDEAIEHLKKMVKNKKNSLYAISALGGLKERYGKDNVQTYFEELLKDANEGNKSRIKKHLANFYLNKDEDDRASAIFDELKDDKRSKKDNFEGLYEKFNYMLHKKKDVVLAKNLLDEMKNKFADDEEANIHIATAEMLMSTINNNHAFGKKQNETAVSIDEVIKEYALSNNYPNPFNPVTTITYQLPKSGSVTLKIFDILGSEVKTLVNEQKEKGRYTVQFDASSLASGMYVYQLRVNDFTSTKKMLLLK